MEGTCHRYVTNEKEFRAKTVVVLTMSSYLSSANQMSRRTKAGESKTLNKMSTSRRPGT
jgi:hypothetical protein